MAQAKEKTYSGEYVSASEVFGDKFAETYAALKAQRSKAIADALSAIKFDDQWAKLQETARKGFAVPDGQVLVVSMGRGDTIKLDVQSPDAPKTGKKGKSSAEKLAALGIAKK